MRKREPALLLSLAVAVATGCGSATLNRSDGGKDGTSSQSDGAPSDTGLDVAPHDGATPTCKGTPADCSSVSAASCTALAGCTVTAGACYGTLVYNNCDLIAGSVCYVEAGCTSNGAGACYSASPVPCNLRPEATCATLGGDGCGWNAPFCGGFATPCSQILNQTACGTQTGCAWGS